MLYFSQKKEPVDIGVFKKIICATGYKTSYALINQLLAGKMPEQRNGITTQTGLYMVGIPTPEESTVTITRSSDEARNAVTDICKRQGRQFGSQRTMHVLSAETVEKVEDKKNMRSRL